MQELFLILARAFSSISLGETGENADLVRVSGWMENSREKMEAWRFSLDSPMEKMILFILPGGRIVDGLFMRGCGEFSLSILHGRKRFSPFSLDGENGEKTGKGFSPMEKSGERCPLGGRKIDFQILSVFSRREKSMLA